MRAMQARGFKGYGDLELVNPPKPEASDGEVLVRMTAAGVTPLDRTILIWPILQDEGSAGSGERRTIL